MFRRQLQSATAATAGLGVLLSCGPALADDDHGQETATPIKHVIVLIGENWTFDGIYATYQPKNKQSVSNLLSRGVVMASGDPGPDFDYSLQYQINQPYPAKYFIDAMSTAGKTAYKQAPGTPSFPPPNTAYVPTSPGGLDQGQGPFGPTVPDSLLPIIEPSLEKSDLGLLRTTWQGVQIDDDSLALDLARTVGLRGNYLAQPHTVAHCREHLWQSRYFGPNMPLNSAGGPDTDLYARIDRDLRQLLQSHRPQPLEPELVDRLRAIRQQFEESHPLAR